MIEIKNQILNGKQPVRNLNDINCIVVHDTGNSSVNVPDSNIMSYLNRTPNASYHYLIGVKGDIYQLMSNEVVAYHAGVSGYNGLRSKNNSLNWCSIGVAVNSNGKEFNDLQRKSMSELLRFLKKQFSVSDKFILRHKDVSPGRKVDIGDNFWNSSFSSWSDYVESLKDESTLERLTRISLIALNSKMWGFTKDNQLKDLLHKTNTILRSK